MSSLPTSVKAAQFFSGLAAPVGQKILQVVGDSINGFSITSPMHIGYRECWNVPWNGYVQGVDNTDFWGYSNRQGTLSRNAIIDPSGTTYSGIAATTLTSLNGESPMRWAEAIWTVAPSSTMGDNYTDKAKYTRMGGRDSWLFMNGQAVSARMIYMDHARNFASVTVRGRRTGSTIANTAYTKPGGATNQIVYTDVSCGTSTTADPNCISLSAAVASGTADAWPLIGVRFRSAEANGVQWQNISHGSWTTGDHIYEGFYTTAGLGRFFAATGIPTHMLVMLGQNTNTGVRAGAAETGLNSGDYAAYKANLVALMSKYETAAIAAAAILGVTYVPMLWCFITMYKTGYAAAYSTGMAQAHYELAQEYSTVSMVNLYRLSGGDNFNTGTNIFLEDGIHPYTDGCRYLASLIWQEGMDAIAAEGGASSVLGFGF